MALVVDTDVVSFLYKRDTRAELYRTRLNDPPFIISFMTLAELRSWMYHRNWGPTRRQHLERYLQRYQLIYASSDLCELWAQVTDSARRHGRPIGAADAWIAATALLQNVSLVTHNRSDYERVEGLSIISES